MPSGKARPWHTMVTPILICTSVAELQLFDWITTSVGILPTHVEAKRLEDNLWEIPRIQNMPVAMKTLLIGAHAKLEMKWNERNKEIEERNKVENKMMPLLPHAWTFEQLKNKIDFVRLIMHRLLYAWPVNEECDVREEIVN
jgi:hypothetical protein